MQQNDVFWDGNATPAGLFAYRYIARKDNITTFSEGYFYLPQNQADFNDRMAAAQVAFNKSISKATLTYAAGINAIQSDITQDFDVVSNSIQTTFDFSDRPLKLGYDLYWNAAADEGNDSAHIANLALGAIEKAGDWIIGANKVIADANSIHTPYSQGDWLIFAQDTTPSGLNGGSFWIKYAISDSSILSAQLFLRDAKLNAQKSNRLPI